MTKVATSPDRHTFQLNGYLERCREEGKAPDPDYVAMYETFKKRDEEMLADPEWRKNNLEWDLRTTSWILEKVVDDRYAQNLYAALCNMRWQRLDVMPILKDELWSCSWRHAGGIVADMQGKGDYIDWYCSGMGGLNQEYDGEETHEQWQERTGYVPEGTVTDEIEEDLFRLGWKPVEWEDEK